MSAKLLPFFFICFFFSTIIYSKTSFNDDIVVYGGLTKKKDKTDPHSISVIQSHNFNDYNSTHFEDLIQVIPNLNSTKGTARTRFFTIRGIGERSSYEGMPNASVGVLIDDIDYTGIGGTSNLAGISQIEVYKGPQSTRLGPSALAGLIYMNSDISSESFEGKLLFSIERFNTFKEQVNVSTPLSPKLKTGLSLSKIDSDGYVKNTFLDREDTAGFDEFSLRSKSSYENESFKALFTIHHNNNKNGYDYFTQDNTLNVKSDKPGVDNQETNATSLRLEYLLGKLKNTTIISLLNDHSFYAYDEDWGNNEQWNRLPGYNADYDYNIEFQKKRTHYYFDHRVSLNDSLTFGLYLKDSTEDFRETSFKDGAIRKNAFGSYDSLNKALFLQSSHGISEKLYIDSGLRIEQREAKYRDSNANNFTPTETMFGGDIGFRYQKNSLNMMYVNLSKGFKAGGFNTQSNVEQSRKSYDQESLYSFEVGAKNQWSDSLKTTLSLFYMLRDDVQVRTSYQDDPNDPSSYTYYTDNATSGTSFGSEFELNFKSSFGLTVLSNFSLLKTSYNNFQVGALNLKDRDFPNSPNYSFNTLIKYSFINNFFVSTNLFMSDNFYYSNSHSQTHPRYELVDGTIGYESSHWNISLWCKNIFDKEYYSRGFFFANEPPNWQDSLYTQRNAPRTFGLTGSYQF